MSKQEALILDGIQTHFSVEFLSVKDCDGYMSAGGTRYHCERCGWEKYVLIDVPEDALRFHYTHCQANGDAP
jgi:hypothetical protein